MEMQKTHLSIGIELCTDSVKKCKELLLLQQLLKAWVNAVEEEGGKVKITTLVTPEMF